MKPISTKSFALVIITLPALAALPALGAEIYKQIDEQGKVTYSNKPIKGGRKVDLPELSTVSIPKEAVKKPEPAPPVPAANPARDALLEAIAKEQKALERARAAARAGADQPEVFKRTETVMGKDGKPTTVTETGRNVAAYEEKMKKLNAEVALHEKNLDDLMTQLVALDKK